MMKKRRQFILNLLSEKLNLKIIKICLILDDCMYNEKTKKTLLRLAWLRDYKNIQIRIYFKKVTGGLLVYYSIEPKKKKN